MSSIDGIMVNSTSARAAARPSAHRRWVGEVLVIWLVLVQPVFAGAGELVEQGQAAFQQGAFGQAAALWEKAVTSFRSQGNTNADIATSVSLASAYQSLGQQRRAIQILEAALDRAEATGDRRRVLVVKGQLGAALVLTQEPERALALLDEALAGAMAAADSRAVAAILNDRGNLLATQKAYPEGLAAYEKCLALARETGNTLLAAQALCNAAATATI